MRNNREISRLAKEYGFYYVDYFTPLYDKETEGLYKHYGADDVHPNDTCYLVMADILNPILSEILGE